MYIYIYIFIYNYDARGKEFSNGNSSSQLCSSLQKDGNREGSEGGREGWGSAFRILVGLDLERGLHVKRGM